MQLHAIEGTLSTTTEQTLCTVECLLHELSGTEALTLLDLRAPDQASAKVKYKNQQLMPAKTKHRIIN